MPFHGAKGRFQRAEARVLERLAGLEARGRATAEGLLALTESDLSAEAKAWLSGAPPLSPGYGGDFLVLTPSEEGRFRVESRISPVER